MERFRCATAEPKASQFEKDADNRVQHAMKIGEQRDIIRPNDSVILVHGTKAGSGNTDTMRVIQYVRN